MNTSLGLVIFVFSFLGLLDTIYLSYHAVNKAPVKCWFFPDEWCQKVQYSSYSKTFGVPNPYLGLMMYAALLCLTIFVFAGTLPAWPVKAIIVFGFLFSMYFTYIQAFVLKAFCTWCVFSAVNFTVMFLAVLFLK